MKSFLIIGMGTFGHHLCKALSQEKCEIMIVDTNSEALEDMLPYVISSRIGDCTRPEVLKTFGVENFDACFVCMGSNFQNSLQITSLLKELGAKKVFSKADEDVQAKFLLRNGADVIMFPEKEIAGRIALTESSENIFECLELTKDYLICEIAPLPNWIGKSIKDLNIRSVYDVSILATKRGDTLLPLPYVDYIFTPEEHIMVLGHIDNIKKITK